MKKILFLFFLSTVIFTLNIQASETYSLKKEIKSFYEKPKYDIRLDIDSRSKGWYEIADVDEAAANNIGYLYEDLKDYKKAEFWYKKSLSLKIDGSTLFNLGLLYETIKKQMSLGIKQPHIILLYFIKV